MSESPPWLAHKRCFSSQSSFIPRAYWADGDQVCAQGLPVPSSRGGASHAAVTVGAVTAKAVCSVPGTLHQGLRPGDKRHTEVGALADCDKGSARQCPTSVRERALGGGRSGAGIAGRGARPGAAPSDTPRHNVPCPGTLAPCPRTTLPLAVTLLCFTSHPNVQS